MSDIHEDDVAFRGIYDPAVNPNGVNPHKLGKALKNLFGLAEPASIKTIGRMDRESQTLRVGSIVVFLDFVPDAGQLAQISAAVATVLPPKQKRKIGIKIEDYDDWLDNVEISAIVWCDDQTRNGGAATGCHVYKSTNKTIRRLADHELLFTAP